MNNFIKSKALKVKKNSNLFKKGLLVALGALVFQTTQINANTQENNCRAIYNYSKELKLNMDFFQEQAVLAYQKDKENQSYDAYYMARYIYINSYIDLYKCENNKKPKIDEVRHKKDKKVWAKYKLSVAIEKKNTRDIEKFKVVLANLNR